jgi:hypothetical protein
MLNISFKNKRSRLFVALIVIFIVSYLIYRFFFAYTPLDWQNYKNSETSHYYSFSYPKNWILTECGNGEVVVGKKKVASCEYPLEASRDYLENVYFQTFIPGEKSSLISTKEASASPELGDWSTTFFSSGEYNYIRMAGTAFPVRSDRKYDLIDDDGTHHPNTLSDFTIGFYPHPELEEEYKYIKNSLEYNRQ